jgi:CRP-like cAMP-binding protein
MTPRPDTRSPRSVCAQPERTGLGATLCRFAEPLQQQPTLRRLQRGDRLPILSARHTLRFRVVRAGLVANAAATPDGRRQILCLGGPDEVICPIAPAGVPSWTEALSAALVCEVDLGARAEDLATDPDFNATLFEIMAGGLERAGMQILALGRFDGTTRVARFLADMTDRLGETRDGVRHLTLPMTREDIADTLGLNAETVSRILSRIRKAGVAQFSSPTALIVPDVRALARFGATGVTA